MFNQYFNEDKALIFDVIPFGGFNFKNCENCCDSGANKGTKELLLQSGCELLDSKENGLEIGEFDEFFKEKSDDKEKDIFLKLDIFHSGGGEVIELTKQGSEKEFVLALERLAEGSTTRKVNGNKYFDKKKIVKHCLTKQVYKIPNDKYNVDKPMLYFFVDTSGSVSYLSKMFIPMIAISAKSQKIVVYEGCESHPQKNSKTNKKLYNDGIRGGRKDILSESLELFLEKESPAFGSVFVFWGDSQGVQFDNECFELLKSYKIYWFNSDEEQFHKNPYSEMKRISQIAEVRYEINSIPKFTKALKRIVL